MYCDQYNYCFENYKACGINLHLGEVGMKWLVVLDGVQAVKREEREGVGG